MNVYRCARCGNIVFHLHESGVPVFCCGQKMELLVPGSVDAAVEKHLPAVTADGRTLHTQVGSTVHPTLEQHYIEWIALETVKGVSVRWLHPGETPAADFVLAGDEKAVAVYAYCNLHGLWRTEV